MIIPKNCTALVKGKVYIEGEVEVVGSKNIRSFECEKFVPVYCLDETRLEVEGECKILDGSTIPESWRKLAEMDWETIFLYGNVDSGKSTLATYLANKIGGAYVLDLDIGQAEVAHAGAMGYGFAKDVTSLSQVQMINGFFVGSITPQGKEVKCLRGVARLWKELKKLEGRKIVNTTGWIKGRRAKEYKLAKIEIIEPDLVVSFEGKIFEDYKVYEVERGFVLKRDRTERFEARCDSYRKFLKNAKTLEVDKESVKLIPDILKGKDVSQFFDAVIGNVMFARLGDDFITICLKEKTEIDGRIIREIKDLYEVSEVFVLSREELKNIIVGLYKGKKYLGMGLLKALDDKLLIESAFTDFDTVELGEIRFEDGREFFIKKY